MRRFHARAVHGQCRHGRLGRHQSAEQSGFPAYAPGARATDEYAGRRVMQVQSCNEFIQQVQLFFLPFDESTTLVQGWFAPPRLGLTALTLVVQAPASGGFGGLGGDALFRHR